MIIIREQGGSRVIAVTKIIPKDWRVVEATITKQTKDAVTVKLNKVG